MVVLEDVGLVVHEPSLQAWFGRFVSGDLVLCSTKFLARPSFGSTDASHLVEHHQSGFEKDFLLFGGEEGRVESEAGGETLRRRRGEVDQGGGGGEGESIRGDERDQVSSSKGGREFEDSPRES